MTENVSRQQFDKRDTPKYTLVKQLDCLPIQPTKLTSSYYLRHKLREKGLHTLRVTNDADVLIEKTAIETTTHNHSVAAVSEDVDPSVLLIVSTLFQHEIS